eukprot:6417040-Pyramimonas_sp.AAC.1
MCAALKGRATRVTGVVPLLVGTRPRAFDRLASARGEGSCERGLLQFFTFLRSYAQTPPEPEST